MIDLWSICHSGWKEILNALVVILLGLKGVVVGGGGGFRARILALIYRHHCLELDCIYDAAGKQSQEL